jgi:integrase
VGLRCIPSEGSGCLWRKSRDRHEALSCSTLLHSLHVDLKVQQELLRHSDIRTTMNIYTQVVPDAMREANSRVVEMVLPKRKVG